MTHSYMNENVAENNQDTLDKVIEDVPDDTYPQMMEYCGNEELDNIN